MTRGAPKLFVKRVLDLMIPSFRSFCVLRSSSDGAFFCPACGTISPPSQALSVLPERPFRFSGSVVPQHVMPKPPKLGHSREQGPLDDVFVAVLQVPGVSVWMIAVSGLSILTILQCLGIVVNRFWIRT